MALGVYAEERARKAIEGVKGKRRTGEDTMARRKQPPPLPEGMQPQRRERNPKDKSPAKPPIVDGEGKLSPGVPDDVKAAVAGAIMAYSAMEAFLEFFIWDVTGLDYDDGRLLTKIDASEKISIAKALTKRYGLRAPVFGQNHRSLWRVMNELAEIRNLMAHGVWGMHELTVPVASSFRLKEDGHEGRIISEGFQLSRLAAITAQCEKVKEILEKMGAAAQASRQKLVEQLLREASKTREHP